MISFLGFQTTFAQNNIQKASQLAFKYFRDKEYKPASVLFHDLYDATKSKTYFDYYIQCLIRINKIKDAEKFIRKQIKRNPYDKTLLITLGYVYKESGRLEKANENFQKVISKIAPVSNDINNVANAFIGKREYDFAIKAYQKGRQLLKRPHAFHFEIANVYLFSRDFENMIKEYLIALEVDQSLSNRVQNRFQSARFQDIDSSIDPILKKQLLAKSQKFPQNIAYQELLQWYFTQKKQFAAALIQAKSIEELEEVVLKLKENVVDLEEKYKKLEERLFSLNNIASKDSLVTFYTGFPNNQTMMALYEYLDPGDNGENIKYWLSGKDLDSTTKSVKQERPRTLKPLDEFFLTLCRLRQGFAELHLAQLFNISQPTVSRVYHLDKLFVF